MAKQITELTPAGALDGTELAWVEQGGSARKATTQDIADLGGGSLTIEDEGAPLATAATTLDFVGAGVVASGTGISKTITIAGGVTTLAALTDTDLTTPADASMFLYDTGTSTWRDALMSGDASLDDTGVITVAPDAITYPKMQNVVADNRILGNIAGAGGVVAELTADNVRTMINVADGATIDQTTIVGIIGTMAEFDTAVTDGNIAYAGGAYHDGFSDFVADEHATPKNSIQVDTAQLQLVGDAASPGNNMHYGTSAGGTKGWYTIPTAGAEVNDLTADVTWDTVPNSFISQGSVTQHVASIDHDLLLNFVSQEHIRWDLTGTGTIHSTNYTDTVYTHPNHSGHVTSVNDGVQTVVVAAITGQTDIGANLVATDEFLVSDAGVIRRADISRLTNYLDGALNFNNYTHPTHPGDDFNIDTLALSGATVVSDIDINITTDTQGHVTDANGIVVTRELTAGDIGAATDSHTHALPDLTDVTSAATTNRFALMANGSAYVGRAIVEADISDLGSYLTSESDTLANVTGRGASTATASTFSGGLNLSDSDLNRPIIEDYGVKHQVLSIGGNAAEFDLRDGNSALIDLQPATGDVTLTITNPPASGTYGELHLHIVQGTVPRNIIWPNSVTWQGGDVEPLLSGVNDAIDVVHMYTLDEGGEWIGTFAVAAAAAAGGVTTVFGRSGAVVAVLADYDSFFLTPTEGNAAYSALGHSHTLSDISDSGALAALNTVGTTQIDNDSVTLAKMANIATQRFLGRTTAATGDPESLTVTQATAMLNVFSATLKGLAPLSGGGTTAFLRADGSWATPPGSGGAVDSVFSRTGTVVAQLSDYDSFFLTPTEGDAAYATVGHTHETFDRASSVLATGVVFSNIVVTDGIVSGIATRTLTPANIGAAADTNVANWDTAYGWGDHSGTYLPLTGGTITGDLTFDKSSGQLNIYFDVPTSSNDVDFAYRINGTLTAIVRWDSGTNQFVWMDRDPSSVTQMVLDLESGDLTLTGDVFGANLNIANWDTAYGWGDHASGGYASSSHNHTAAETTSGVFTAARLGSTQESATVKLNTMQRNRWSSNQEMAGTTDWDEGVYGGYSTMTNGPSGMNYDPFLVMGSGSDVRSFLVVPRTASRAIAYKGSSSSGASHTAWHYSGWTTTVADAALSLYAKISSPTFTGTVDAPLLRVNTLGNINGNYLVINSGESSAYATGQTAEFLYINAEQGLQVNSSPDNWGSVWAGRDTATICAAGGQSTFPAQITVTGHGNSSQWNTAYGWGNHASGGYITGESDTLANVTSRGSTTSTASTFSGGLNLSDSDLNRPIIEDYAVKHQVATVSGTTVTVNLQLGNSALIDLQPATGDVTLTITNPPSTGKYGELHLHIVQSSVPRNIIWPGTVTWQGGDTEPLLSGVEDAVDVVHLYTLDFGDNWYGTFAVAAAAAGGYTHPSHPGDDFDQDTGLLANAFVVSDININLVTDTLGHVTDANCVIATRQLTAGNIGAATSGHTHETYDHSAHLGGATVFDQINVTNGIVTSILTRALTAGDVGAATSSHTHTFDSLTSKASGTGNYTTTGDMTADNFEATGLGPSTNAGTDDLYIGGYGIIGSRTSGVYVSNAAGSVKLNYSGNHGNAVKLETTTGGVTITGNITVTGLVDGKDVATLTSNTGTVTAVNNGSGMNFTNITGSGTVTLGTPGTLTGSTSNALQTSSHTHSITTTGTGSIVASASPTFTGTVLGAALTFTGQVQGGTLNASSDVRLKENLSRYVPSPLRFKTYSYDLKAGDQKNKVGYLAHEVAKDLPGAVSRGKDGMLALDYNMVLVAKIAELEARLKAAGIK